MGKADFSNRRFPSWGRFLIGTSGTRLMIAQNQILDSDGAGIRLEDVKHSLITNNLIRDDRPEDERSKEPSLLVVKSAENQISANMLGNSP